MGSADEAIASSLNARLEAFRQSDASRNALLEQLVHEYRTLEVRFQEKCDDYENEVSSRRHWQNTFAIVKRDFDALREQTESNPFALALIDGDGAMFHEHLLKQGADGGSEAAHLLMGEIKNHLQDRHGSGGNWSIMVQIYANFEGLSRKLAHIGILRSPAELHTFARAFSCNQSLFSFIDVGSGKERADHKMKEMFRVFMSNAQCKHIIFGGCHDNGYLPVLEPFKRDERVTSRATLLETTTAERGFVNLGMNITKFPSVFRNDPLPDGRPLPERQLLGSSALFGTELPPFNPQNSATNNVFTNTTISPLPTPPGKSVPTVQQPFDQQVPTPDPSPAPTPTPIAPGPIGQKPSETRQTPVPKAATVSPTSTSSKPSTYASVGGNDVASKQISIAAEKPTPPKKAVYLNAYDERIDLKLAKAEPAAVASLHQRIKQKKVCNNFHLLHYCAAGKECNYGHEPKLSAKEQLALKLKARDRPCGQGSACRDVECLSGHHCPRGEDCAFEYCIFGDDSHYIDRAIKLKYFGDGDVEIVH